MARLESIPQALESTGVDDYEELSTFVYVTRRSSVRGLYERTRGSQSFT